MNLMIQERPTTFEGVIGQDSTVKALQECLSAKDHPRCFLFTGMPGVGKTTLARIIANKVGANSHSIFEINAADLRGIDGAREIVAKTRVRIAGTQASVFVLDECHQLTKEAQNLLLKVLEDTPVGCYFILCTTDALKILPAIKTRCTSYVLNPVDQDLMVDFLLEVSTKHKLNIDNEMLLAIIQYAGGSVRLALNMLQNCQGCKNKEDVEQVIRASSVSFVEIGGSKVAEQFFNVFMGGADEKLKWQSLMTFTRKLKTQVDIDDVRQGLKGLFTISLMREYHPLKVRVLEEIDKAVFFSGKGSFVCLLGRIIETMKGN